MKKEVEGKTAILMPGGIGDSLFFLVYYVNFSDEQKENLYFIVNEKSTIELLSLFNVPIDKVIYLGGNGKFGFKTFLRNVFKIRGYAFERVLLMPEVNIKVWVPVFKIYNAKKIIFVSGQNQHPILSVKELIKKAGFDCEIGTLKISIKEDEKVSRVEEFMRKHKIIIGVHTGSKPNKRWPIENYLEIVARLIKKVDVGFIFFGTKTDIDKGFKLISDNMLDLYGKLTLKQTFYYVSRCDIFLSNDTGLMHIAALSGVKTIGLFGPTDWRLYYPYGKENIIIHGNLKCQPCYYKRKFSCDDIPPECMLNISVDEVEEAIIKMLKI